MKWFLILIAANGSIVISNPIGSLTMCKDRMQYVQQGTESFKSVGCFYKKEYGDGTPTIFFPSDYKPE